MTEIAKEYGAAIFMLACEEGKKKEYGAALDLIKAAFEENPEYLEMLSSPAIPLGERISAIEGAFSGKAPEYVISYLALLCEKGRISSFIESVEEYGALLDASERILTAKITSAVALTEEEKQKLISKLEGLEGSKVIAEYFVDKALISGLIVEIDGKILDGSLRHRLNEVKEVMNK